MKILIVKIGAIGDVIMMSPVLETIKLDNKDHVISWATGKIVSPIVKEFSNVKSLIEIDENKLFKGNLLVRLIEIVKFWKNITFKGFDLILMGHADERYNLLLLPLFFVQKRKFKRSSSARPWPIPQRHHTHEYIRLFLNEEIKHSIDIIYPKIKINPEILKSIENDNKKLIILAPGGAKNHLNDDILRRWPIESYVLLTRKLIASGHKVAIIGSSSDIWVIEHFNDIDVIDKINNYHLTDTISFLSGGDCFVSHDSGPLHLCALAGIPYVGLFGPTDPNEKVPFIKNSIALSNMNTLPCSPCYDGKTYAACLNNICLKFISAELVLEKVKEVLAKNT